jgi:hypothetical protein
MGLKPAFEWVFVGLIAIKWASPVPFWTNWCPIDSEVWTLLVLPFGTRICIGLVQIMDAVIYHQDYYLQALSAAGFDEGSCKVLAGEQFGFGGLACPIIILVVSISVSPSEHRTIPYMSMLQTWVLPKSWRCDYSFDYCQIDWSRIEFMRQWTWGGKNIRKALISVQCGHNAGGGRCLYIMPHPPPSTTKCECGLQLCSYIAEEIIEDILDN